MNTYQNVNIVIADDDGTTRAALRLLLREHGYTVVGEAANGARAVELCASFRPDIVFLDIHMPKLDGNQAAQQIRQHSPNIGMIMISALATVSNVRQAMQAGVSGFVVKPFNAVKVVEAVDHCLKNNRYRGVGDGG